MTVVQLTNNTPFLVVTSTAYQPPYFGSSWYSIPSTVTVEPGATAEIGYLDDPTTDPGPSCWGWLYLYHDDGGGLQAGHQLQVFAESRPGGDIFGAVGPAAAGSTPNDPMPLGGASGVVDLDGPLPVLTCVYNGYETGIGQQWLAGDLPALDLPCAIGTFLDIAVQSTRLFVLGTSVRAQDAPEIFVAWVDLPAGGDIVGLLNDATSWSASQFVLPTWTQVGARSTPSALSRGSMATMDDNLVYFWNNADYNDGEITWRLLSAEYLYDGTSDTYWGSPIEMQDPDGNPVVSAGNCGQYQPGPTWFTPDVAAAALPSVEDPAVCIAGLLRPAAAGPVDRASTLELYCYRHDGIAAGTGQEKTFVWPAASMQTLAVGDLLAQAGLDATGVGLSLSFDFYTTFPAQTEATTAPPETWMVLSLAAADASQAALFVLPFDAATATAGTQAAATALVSTSSEPAVQCDASGRVGVLWNSNDGAEQLNTLIIPNNEEPTAAMLTAGAVTVPAISGSTAAPYWWMCDQSSCATTTTPVDGDSAYPPGTNPTALRFPIYRLLCYQGGPLRGAAQLVGWCEQTSGVNGPPVPKEGLTRKLLVGLIDGPVPVPGANLAADPGTGGTYNTVTYGRASDESSGYSAQSSLGWGVKSTAGFTVGYGPAWDISVSSATTKSASEQVETTLETYLPVPSSYDATGSITSHGYALSTDVTMTALRFQLIEPGLPPLYTPQAAKNAAVFVQFQVNFSNSTDQWSFEPYAATPGDLHSYTAPAIDQRLQALGVTNQADYVESVIEPASVALKVDYSGNNPIPEQTTFYLNWDTGVMGTATANVSVEGFQEQGWSLNTQDYVGFSGGFNFAANDPQVSVGVTAWNFSVMAGLLLTDSNDTTETTGSSWQLEIDGPGPAMPEQPAAGVANHYEFTMYLLPSSTQWTAELIQGLTVQKQNGEQPIWATLDPSEIVAGSAPWRITFLVTQITEYNPATKEYETTFPPSSP